MRFQDKGTIQGPVAALEISCRAVIIGFFALLTALAFQSSGDANRVRELAPGVFFWQGDRETQRQTNIGWVVFRDYAVVIDANFPWGARDVIPEIRKTGQAAAIRLQHALSR